jgi:lipopolysaccharide export system protein LptA
MKPEEEVRMAALPRSLPPAEVEKERAGDKAPAPKIPVEFEKFKVGELGEPIDITSDTVETFSKENLIAFKGNVIARQKDVVIYADSLEAVLSQDGKGIDRVIAGGNVKIQQGLRVASCQKAVFYNLERKVVLTGDPKVLDGENMVSGEEILFDVERNRVEVKGGSVERGKAKIQP